MNIIQFNNSILKYNEDWLEHKEPDPYNPLNLPPNTIRVKFVEGYVPDMGDTRTLIDADENIWDIYRESNDWYRLFYAKANLTEVIGANTTNITNMKEMFNGGWSLTSLSIFDTRNVTDMESMFEHCTTLQSIPAYYTPNVTTMKMMFYESYDLRYVPLLDTSKVTNMNHMFYNCVNVKSGALALYQQASTQVNPPSSHVDTFNSCGSSTVSGAIELDQIPKSWGGKGA
jgi:surface protein